MPRNGRSRGARRDTRDVILEAAAELFNREDMRAVAVDAIVAQSGVSKATVYRHFRSKDEIVVAFLRRRDRLVRDHLSTLLREPLTPVQRILDVFAKVERWCERPEFRGSAFTGAAIEFSDTSHPVWDVVAEHTEFVTAWMRAQAHEAGAADADALAHQLVILVEGAVDVALLRQDATIARFATAAAERLLEPLG